MSKIQVAIAVVSALTFTTRIAAADDQASPPPAPAPAPYQPPGGAPPGSPPPGYGPPGYALQPSGAPIYGPEEITDFGNSAPVPYGYTKVTRRRKGLIIGGAATLGATYGVTAFTGMLAIAFRPINRSAPDPTPFFIPVVGPFVAIAQSKDSTGDFGLVAIGLGQTAGAIMLVYGLTHSREVLVRNDQLAITSIAPLVAPGASGLSVVGRF
jgi:hypothetical protein